MNMTRVIGITLGNKSVERILDRHQNVLWQKAVVVDDRTYRDSMFHIYADENALGIFKVNGALTNVPELELCEVRKSDYLDPNKDVTIGSILSDDNNWIPLGLDEDFRITDDTVLYIRNRNSYFSESASKYISLSVDVNFCTNGDISSLINYGNIKQYMFCSLFRGSSIITPPTLPAITLAQSCYSNMFYNCTSLTTAPTLPATTLASYCYYSMFYRCTSLVTAPTLPATTLESNCYSYMFGNCTSLNYVKAMFTTTPDTAYTNNWLNNVAVNGTFVKNANATWNVTGVNGVPSGWTIETVTP